MALRDRALDALRRVFGTEREERRDAESPSVAALAAMPPSMFSLYGRDEMGGMLSISQSLMDRFADYESMEEYPDIGCLQGLTPIFTLEFGWIAVEELAKRGQEFHVLAYDAKRKAIVPALAKNARRTQAAGHKKPMVRVTFDNGASITCTADHPFMLKDEKWVEAGDLTVGASLMPGDIRLRSLGSSATGQYWQVRQPRWDTQLRAIDGKLWTWVHRLVANEYCDANLGNVVHHKDENPLNNAPSNISIETPTSHGVEHTDAAKKKRRKMPPWNDERRRAVSNRALTLAARRGPSRGPVKTKGVLSEEHRRRIGEANRLKLTREQIERAFDEALSIRGAAKLLKVSAETVKRHATRLGISLGSNHRVFKVEFLDERPDVYDIEVPGYHNFIANGVIVHNCVAEGCRVYIIEGSVLRPVPIEQVAIAGEMMILGFDLRRQTIVKIAGRNPRLTSTDAPVLALMLSNGKKLRVTPDHKILTTDGYIEAKDLKKGARVVSMWAGFNPDAITVMTEPRYGVLDLLDDPTPDGSAKVYDITTDTHNFICEGAVVHNSSFRYYANDATQPSIENGRALWASSEDDALLGILDDLIVKKLRAEEDLYADAYELGMYGNKYSELLLTNDGVIGLNHLPAPTMRRVDALDGSLIGFVQDINGGFTANSHELRAMLAGNVEIPPSLALFEDWQVVHMRLRATRRRSPYGTSVAEQSRWVWKRLLVLEDMAIIYRATRIPRYAIYVDVTDVPSDRVEAFLQKTKRDLRKKKLVNPRTGRLDMRYNVLSQDEDFIIGVREGRELARVDVLSAPDWNTLDDIDYFKKMLHGSLGVPRAWLGQEEPIQGKGILSNEDVRAARTTLNMQREMRLGWERICRVHLAARGMKNPWKPEFQILMTVPSGIWELAAYETLNARADYAARVQPFVSVRWIQENVLKLSDEQVKAIEKERKKEQEQGLGAMPFGGGAPPPPLPPPGGPEGGPAGAPEEEPEKPEPGSPAAEWKRYDAAQRLEEHRYRESCRRQDEIVNKLGKVLENQDDAFVAREYERREFFKTLKESGFTKRGNFTVAIPSGGHRTNGNGNGRRNGSHK